MWNIATSCGTNYLYLFCNMETLVRIVDKRFYKYAAIKDDLLSKNNTELSPCFYSISFHNKISNRKIKQCTKNSTLVQYPALLWQFWITYVTSVCTILRITLNYAIKYETISVSWMSFILLSTMEPRFPSIIGFWEYVVNQNIISGELWLLIITTCYYKRNTNM